MPEPDEATSPPFADARFKPLVEAFKALYQKRRDGGGALAAYVHGRPVLDVWAGYADVDAGTPWVEDTMAMSWSTTKGVASTLAHRLIDAGVLDVSKPVATWWPEFAAHGKGDITLAQLMSHQAGLDRVRGVAEAPGDLLDHRRMADIMAARPAGEHRGRSAYHAVTYGYLMAAVVEKATGERFGDLLATHVGEPLGLDGLYVSTPPHDHHRIAPFFESIAPLGIDLGWAGHWLKKLPPLRGFVNALMPRGLEEFINTPAMWQATMPAANGIFTARSLARMYAPLANGGQLDGKTFLSAETLDAAGKVQTRDRDAVLGFKMRWRLGYHQAFVVGADQPRMAFGHFGLGGSGAWADPETGLSLAFVTNKMGAATTPIADRRLAKLGGVALTCVRGES